MSQNHNIVDYRSNLTTDGEAGGAGQGYTINFINNSANQGSAFVFQTNPGPVITGLVSLAWFSYGTNPGTIATFHWSIDYGMLWSTTANLVPGVVVMASQNLPCTLQTNNEATFTKNEFGYVLNKQVTSTVPGITILEDPSIPANSASVGMSMSGAGVFAVPAQPNLTVNFSVTPTYWIAFSLQSVQKGAVLISQAVTMKQQITFPVNKYICTATLNVDNTWNIAYD